MQQWYICGETWLKMKKLACWFAKPDLNLETALLLGKETKKQRQYTLAWISNTDHSISYVGYMDDWIGGKGNCAFVDTMDMCYDGLSSSKYLKISSLLDVSPRAGVVNGNEKSHHSTTSCFSIYSFSYILLLPPRLIPSCNKTTCLWSPSLNNQPNNEITSLARYCSILGSDNSGPGEHFTLPLVPIPAIRFSICKDWQNGTKRSHRCCCYACSLAKVSYQALDVYLSMNHLLTTNIVKRRFSLLTKVID